ncbi:hypothetical protein GGR57DRAFT_505871 [Xylariaceae sp. FL1272]|nr:hypothetical protein GGR57DRAFT_505871 [Xylariaceae sp. FL1272]
MSKDSFFHLPTGSTLNYSFDPSLGDEKMSEDSIPIAGMSPFHLPTESDPLWKQLYPDKKSLFDYDWVGSLASYEMTLNERPGADLTFADNNGLSDSLTAFDFPEAIQTGAYSDHMASTPGLTSCSSESTPDMQRLRYTVFPQSNGDLSQTDHDAQSGEKQRCPHPGCGRVFKDLKAHMLTHQNARPEKCPIQTCDYHVRGFARKYDRNRHALTHYKGTMVCGFCPGSGSAAEKSFNRADVFKRHLTAVHGVEQTPMHMRKKTWPTLGPGSKPKGYAPDATGKCSTCPTSFANAQDFYEHLDECVLRVVQHKDPVEATGAKRPAIVDDADDDDDDGPGRKRQHFADGLRVDDGPSRLTTDNVTLLIAGKAKANHPDRHREPQEESTSRAIREHKADELKEQDPQVFSQRSFSQKTSSSTFPLGRSMASSEEQRSLQDCPPP